MRSPRDDVASCRGEVKKPSRQPPRRILPSACSWTRQRPAGSLELPGEVPVVFRMVKKSTNRHCRRRARWTGPVRWCSGAGARAPSAVREQGTAGTWGGCPGGMTCPMQLILAVLQFLRLRASVSVSRCCLGTPAASLRTCRMTNRMSDGSWGGRVLPVVASCRWPPVVTPAAELQMQMRISAPTTETHDQNAPLAPAPSSWS